MRIKRTIKSLTILVTVFAFGAVGTSLWIGSAKAEDSGRLLSQNTSRQRLRDGSNCTTGGGYNNNGYNNNTNTDASGSANSGNGNGNNSGVNKSKGKGGLK